MKYLFHINVSLIFIWIAIMFIEPVYGFMSIIIHGFIQVIMSVMMLFDKKLDQQVHRFAKIHFVASVIACVLIFTTGLHQAAFLTITGFILAFVLFFFSLISTRQCIHFENPNLKSHA